MADTPTQENLPRSPMAKEEGESNEQIKEPEPNEQRAQEALAIDQEAHQEAGRKAIDQVACHTSYTIGQIARFERQLFLGAIMYPQIRDFVCASFTSIVNLVVTFITTLSKKTKGGGADVKVKKKAEKTKGVGATKGGGGGGGAAKGGGGGADVKAKQGKQVLVPIANGTDAIEATVTIDVLRIAGAEVIVASVETGRQVVCYCRVEIIADKLISTCAGEFDLIAIPGGSEKAVTTLAACKTLKEMVKNQADKNNLCAAIGAARDLLVLFTGKKDMWSTATESRCVEDNNTVTSKGPGSAIEYAIVLVRKLYGVDMADKVSKLLVGSPQYGVKYAFKEQVHVDWMIYRDQKILVPVADGTEEMEAIIIVDVLQRAGAKVVVASVNNDRTRKHIKASNGVKFVADEQLNNVANESFALIVLPGNLADAMIFQRSNILVKMLKKQNDGNKPYGAICLSPILVLQKHGLLEGRKATAAPRPMCNMLADREYAAHRVVVDGNVATSQGPGSSMEFALVIVEKLFGKEKAIDLAVSMAFCEISEF